MRYLLFIAVAITLSSCGAETTTDSHTPNTDSTTVDSAQQHQDDEVAEEIIENSFDALNR